MQGLKEGSLLRHGTYRIERILGQGGFGITYLAYDQNLERYVAIKEFFPKDFCDREEATSHVTLGTKNTAELVNRMKAKFLKEARNIAKFDHPGIIKVYTSFEENNTAYFVMDYIEGHNLSQIVRSNGPLPEKRAVGYIKEAGEALEYVHKHHINHLDIKPANIMVRDSDDRAILIDFGLSKQYDAEGHQTSTNPTGISHGYAPIEQYKEGGVKEFSPQTDLYSLAATLYYILTGVVPPQASDLIENELAFPTTIPTNLIGPIGKAMSVARKNRHESIESFLSEISEINTIIVKDKKTSGNKIAAYIIVILAIIGGFLILSDYIKKKSSNDHEEILSNEEIVQNLIHNMVFVDGGSFMMGSEDGYSSEKPMHQEKVGHFSIGKYEVTQKEWKTVMGYNPSEFKGDELPVENISWYECQEFIQKLNDITGKNFRLPTEEEWEYAARGGENYDKGLTYSGSYDLDEVAWNPENSDKKTHKVGTKKPNRLGIFDMTGNVQEWTSSNWREDYDAKSDPEKIVVRGGDYCNWVNHQFVSTRLSFNPNDHKNYIGLRLALSIN